jgi:peptidoglycan pentaglycine glycine transferase (the first glycine)
MSGAAALQIAVEREDPGEGWDAFVASHPHGHLMQSRAWACVLQTIGWTPTFLRVMDSCRLHGVALLLRRRIPGTPLSLLYVPRGPVLDYSQAELVEAFGIGLQRVARDHAAFLVQTDPAIAQDHPTAHAALTHIGLHRVEKHGLFRVAQPLRVMRIPLDAYAGTEGLLAALPHKTRYNIGLAARRGVTIVPRTDREACLTFHSLLKAAARKKGYPVRGLKFHEAIWSWCVRTGLGEYLFAEHEGRALAAIQVLRFGTTAWYMYGASSREDRELMPTYLLQWEAIRRAWAAGCRCYDMRGVHSAAPDRKDPEYGVYEFKRKFNAEMVTFIGEYDLVVRPCAYATWRLLERATQRPAAWGLWLWNRLRLSA